VRAAGRRAYRRNPDSFKQRRAIRSARLANAPRVERIVKRTVFTRDDGICHICHKPVLFDKMHMDHVIPISRGGTHTYDNVKTAHAFCNLSKGDKLVA
jgi:hypothetical protein